VDGMKRRPGEGRAAIIGGAIIVLLLGTALPAHAHSITGYQWTSVDQICVSGPCVSQGNLIGAWQAILWADGYLDKCGGSGIDGVFGSHTKGATKSWQTAHHLTSDGIVGPLTWGAARSTLKFTGTHPIFAPGGRLLSSVQYWNYVGKKHTVHFQYANPIWAFRSPASSSQTTYYATSHPSIFFARC
jgi:peptidoglycan hydrolase-like protein with peptidoglycan-binding domain